MPRGDGTLFPSSLTSRPLQLALPHPTHAGPTPMSGQHSPTGHTEARLDTEKPQGLLTGHRRGKVFMNTAPGSRSGGEYENNQA